MIPMAHYSPERDRGRFVSIGYFGICGIPARFWKPKKKVPLALDVCDTIERDFGSPPKAGINFRRLLAVSPAFKSRRHAPCLGNAAGHVHTAAGARSASNSAQQSVPLEGSPGEVAVV